MSQFWKTKKFSALSKKWEAKLAQSGFVDIEKEIQGERFLRQTASNVYRTRNQTFINAKLEFYDLVCKLVQSEQSFTKRDHIVMSNFANGIKQKQTISDLKARGIECNRRTITRVISRYLIKWNVPTQKLRKAK